MSKFFVFLLCALLTVPALCSAARAGEDGFPAGAKEIPIPWVSADVKGLETLNRGK